MTFKEKISLRLKNNCKCLVTKEVMGDPQKMIVYFFCFPWASFIPIKPKKFK